MATHISGPMHFRAGDAGPIVTSYLEDALEVPIPLAGCTVVFRVRRATYPASAIVLEKSCTIVDADTAQVSWQPAATDFPASAAGAYNGFYVVHKPGMDPISIPNSQDIDVTVYPRF